MPQTMLGWRVEELAHESAAKPYDCIIVGGGSAGLTAACTLAEAGARVAVLEAGPAPFLTHISNTELRFNRALSDDVRNQTQYSPKLSDGITPFGPNFGCLGGKGLFWNGAAPRFQPHDFEGWPFSASDLSNEYAWAEHEFRVTSRLGETKLAKKLTDRLRSAGFQAIAGPFAVDVDPLRPGCLGAGIASGLTLFFRRAGAAIASGLIRVAVRAQATELLLSNGSVRGVAAIHGPDSSPAEIFGRSVVLAAGCIESIRLAANSVVPDPGGRLGKGIQEHHFYRTSSDAPHLYDKAAADSAVVFIPSASQASEQWEFHAPGRRLFSLDDGRPWSPEPGDAYQLMIRSFAATAKTLENHVVSRKGPPGSATIHFGYTAEDDARREYIKNQFRKITEALSLTVTDDRFAGPGGSYHEAGGLDMGTDETTSVVNPWGVFHKVSNLVALDAAAFPRIGATNPHLTIVAVARRQATRLAESLKP
jgi:GMC oxidoreductase/FAD binding domain